MIKEILVAGVVFAVGVNYFGPSDAEKKVALAECNAKYGAENIDRVNRFSGSCMFTDEYKEAQKTAKQKAKDAAKAEKALAEAKAKAEREAFLKTPKGKTETFVRQASAQCRTDIRARAKYPSKVDFNWLDGNNERYWMDFKDGKSRVLINKAGEMMNGLGMMVPFTAACKYDYNPETNKYSTVEIIIS